ncbi:hypothetical protein MMPV_008314 [Pyropia vietnamensis]
MARRAAAAAAAAAASAIVDGVADSGGGGGGGGGSGGGRRGVSGVWSALASLRRALPWTGDGRRGGAGARWSGDGDGTAEPPPPLVWRRSRIDRVDEEPEVAGELLLDAPAADGDDWDAAAHDDRLSPVAAGWGGDARVPPPPSRPPSPSPSPSAVPPPTGTPTPLPSAAPTPTPTPVGATAPPTQRPVPTVPPYRGYIPVTAPLPGAVNVTHLSLMMYKLVMGLQPGVRSIVDLPCDATAEWMPSVLARLAYEVPALSYTCVWTAAGAGGRAAAAHKAALSATTATVRFVYRPGVSVVGVGGEGVPAAALALSWGGFQGWSHRAVWRYFRALQAAGVGWVAFQNTLAAEPGGAANTPGKPVNVRRPPFHFGAAARIFNNLEVPLPPSPSPSLSPLPSPTGDAAAAAAPGLVLPAAAMFGMIVTSPTPASTSTVFRKQMLLYEVNKLRGETYFRKMRRYRHRHEPVGEAAVEAEEVAEAERQRFHIY